MVMVGHEKRLAEPLRWTRAGRLAVIAVAALLLAGTIAGGVWSLLGSSSTKPGCIDVTFASTLGAAAIHPCGAKAKALCASPAQNPAAAAHGALRDACERARLPYRTATGGR